MSSLPHRVRLQAPGEAASASPQSSSSSPSTSSTGSISSHSTRPQQQEQEPSFSLHRLLQTSQEPVAEKIASYILWDVRENPLGEGAQYVEQLGTKLSAETLNEFATNPPMSFLKVVCHFPEYWEVVVWERKIRNKQLGSVGTRTTVPVYPSTAATTSALAHSRSLSVPMRVDPPPRPRMRPVPLPASTPPPLFTAQGNTVPIASMPVPPHRLPQQQTQPPRETGITIGDLLSAIYEHVNYNGIHTADLESLPGKQRMRVEDACDKRSKLSPISETAPVLLNSPTLTTAFASGSAAPSTSGAMSQATASTSATSHGAPIVGMKMVDKLLRHTWFAGLTVTREETVTLTLKNPTAN